MKRLPPLLFVHLTYVHIVSGDGGRLSPSGYYSFLMLAHQNALLRSTFIDCANLGVTV